MGNGIFAPDSNITRAQFAVMFTRLIGASQVGYKGVFTDVAEGQWYTAAVETIADMGYIKGYGDGKFHPSDTITYQDMFVIAYQYLADNNLLAEGYKQSIIITDFMEKENMEFGDYAKTAVNELYAYGLIRYPYLEFIRKPCTRIHVAEFLNGVRNFEQMVREYDAAL
jgi:hypothetical protein